MTTLPARLVQVLIVLLLLGVFPTNMANANGADPLTYINGQPRMQGMVMLYEAFMSHGSFAGPYTTIEVPIEGLDSYTARQLYELSSDVAFKSVVYNGHVGFNLPPGEYILLVGASGPINRRVPFTVTDTGGTWVEISGLFFDPRSNDFAVRLQASYIGRGQHPRSNKDAEKPIPGGALYIEASWEQVQSMVEGSQFKITSAVFEGYGPRKHTNMFVGGNLFEKHAQGVSYINAYDGLEIREPNHNPDYVPWDALVDGEVVPGVDGAGVCGFLAPGMSVIFRLHLATGTFYHFEGVGHYVGHRYNPTGNDPNLWARTPGGRYLVVDSTSMDPGPDFEFWSAKKFSFSFTPLIYVPDTWDEMFYITEAHFVN